MTANVGFIKRVSHVSHLVKSHSTIFPLTGFDVKKSTWLIGMEVCCSMMFAVAGTMKLLGKLYEEDV